VGIIVVGGPGAFWEALAPVQRQALPAFNHPPDFNFVGIFWQDGMAGGIAFYFMNQGILLRFLSARSVGDARKAATTVLLVLMPLAAISVSGAGWIGRAMVSRGLLPAGTEPSGIFVAVAEQVLPIGLFGLVVAALIAALMSTADTLINAIATITVVDLWRPWRKARRRETGGRPELTAARITSALATIAGFSLVPLFAGFGSIYRAHGAFTAAVTPPLAVTLVLGFCWRRLSARAALLVMVGGTAMIVLSFLFPGMVAPFAHGVDLEAGSRSYSYIRALYGLVVCTGLGLAGAWIWPRQRKVDPTLSLGSMIEKMRAFKGGGAPRTGAAPRLRMRVAALPEEESSLVSDETPPVALNQEEASKLQLRHDDLVSIWEAHWFRGGYQALTGRVQIDEGSDGQVRVSQRHLARLRLKEGTAVHVRRLL
jgi:SSS family solute:Na+ symporter